MNRHLRKDDNQIGEVDRTNLDSGASLVEYMLMLSLVLLVALAGVTAGGGTFGG